LLNYSIAFSTPNVYMGGGIGGIACGENNYEIQLWECIGGGFSPVYDISSGSPVPVIHPYGQVCQQWQNVKLNPCAVATYMCTVLSFNGGPNQPDQDVFIEWYWKMLSIEFVGGGLITGKMTFVASKEYLLAQYNVNGNFSGPAIGGASGLPLLNCTNHSQ
jgi:hypothetical protein